MDASRIVFAGLCAAFLGFGSGWAAAEEPLEAAFARARSWVSAPEAPVSPMEAPRTRVAANEDASFGDVLSFIRTVARERRDELLAVSGRRPGAVERQGAFLEYMVALEPLPRMVYDDIAASRFTYEFYDAKRDVITMDRPLAEVALELRSAILLHSLRHYFAVTRNEPRARGREGQQDAFEAQAIFWTVIRAPRDGPLYRHHEALASAYASGTLPELMDRFERGWLW